MKRFLVFILIIMLSFSAAANAKFADDDEIMHPEAVNMLVAIGVVDGYGDGNFRPNESISRAEVAKILSMVLNGGREPDSLSGPDFSVFNDIRNHWAEAYINYIASLGIVSGYGSGRFGPGDTVTGQQLSKMLLVSLNYDPEIEQLEGVSWAENTNSLAEQIGLYKGLGSGFDSSLALNRDQAMCIISNALYADRVMYNFDTSLGVTAKVKTGSSIMESSFNAQVVTGIIVANKFGAVNAAAKEASRAYDMESTALIDSGLINDLPAEITAFKMQADVNMLGAAVTAVINRSTREVYGMTGTGSAGIYVIDRASNLEESRFELEQNGFTLNRAPLYVNFELSGTYEGNKAGCVTRFADYNGDGIIDAALAIEPFVAWYEGMGRISYQGGQSIPSYNQLEYSGSAFEAGQPVLCTVLSGVNYVKSCNMLTGVVSSIAADLSSINVGGTHYENSMLNGARSIGESSIVTSEIVILYLDDFGYIIAGESFK